jgi:hypothetical protein
VVAQDPATRARACAAQLLPAAWRDDEVFGPEGQLLRERGYTVLEYSEHTRILSTHKLRLAAETVWSVRSKRKLAGVLAEFRRTWLISTIRFR